MKRHYNGRYRIDYFQKTLPVLLMFWTAVAGLGFKTSNIIVEAWGDTPVDHAEKVQISPTPTPQLAIIEPTIMPTATPTPDESELIDQAVNEFLPNHKSESLMIMHCLAHRESGHGASNAHGDNGLAGGPFQFHEATWERMRKQMGEPFSTRYDFKEAARTTAWAIANGRALEWGPILRASKGSNYASCQVPSWYR